MPTCPNCGIERKSLDAPCSVCGKASQTEEPSPQTLPEASREQTPPNETIIAKRKRKSETAGTGCVIQVIGLVAFFFFPIGTILGIVLFIYGSSKSIYLICSNCGNRLSDKHVKICPVCKAVLK